MSRKKDRYKISEELISDIKKVGRTYSFKNFKKPVKVCDFDSRASCKYFTNGEWSITGPQGELKVISRSGTASYMMSKQSKPHALHAHVILAKTVMCMKDSECVLLVDGDRMNWRHENVIVFDPSMVDGLDQYRDTPVFAHDDGTIYGVEKHLFYKRDCTKATSGYLNMYISKRLTLCHRVVAESKLGPVPESMVVDHVNRDSSDNRISNLRYATVSENMKNRSKYGTRVERPVFSDSLPKLDLYPLSGHAGYLIDKNGWVFSKISNKYLKRHVHNGYTNVGIAKGCGGPSKPVHRLVAETFIPNPDNKPFVHHIDHNRQNCQVDNLMWVTAQENSVL